MASTYSQIKTGLDNISSAISTARNRLTQAQQQTNTAVAELGSLQTQYASLIADINDLATAEPANAASQNAKAEKDKLVAEFQALNTLAASLKTAVDGVLNA